jgi:transcriptional antiterminator Rof (Rho-off)
VTCVTCESYALENHESISLCIFRLELILHQRNSVHFQSSAKKLFPNQLVYKTEYLVLQNTLQIGQEIDIRDHNSETFV